MQQKSMQYIICFTVSLVTTINSQNTFISQFKEFFVEAKPVEDIIREEGYPAAVYKVTTEDGYILTVHQIAHGRSGSSGGQSRPPVFLQHGLFDSSAAWVLRGRNTSLGFILADAGYDVWMSNCRGNTLSRAHVRLNPDRDSQFWDFSFHEMGYYDLPAVIDFILKKTSHMQIVYVAHSMGATMQYVLLSTRPEYNAKILASFNMASVAYLYHQTNSLVKLVHAFRVKLISVLQWFGIYEIMPMNKANSKFYEIICSGWLQEICYSVMESIVDSPEFDKALLPTILKYIPSGTSLKNLIHFSQLISEDHYFRYYDYGYIGNYRHYRQLYSPPYPLSKINTSLYIYYCDKDSFSNLQDLKNFIKDIPSVVYKYRVPEARFSHFDYIWGINVRTLLYDDIMKKIKELRQW